MITAKQTKTPETLSKCFQTLKGGTLEFTLEDLTHPYTEEIAAAKTQLEQGDSEFKGKVRSVKLHPDDQFLTIDDKINLYKILKMLPQVSISFLAVQSAYSYHLLADIVYDITVDEVTIDAQGTNVIPSFNIFLRACENLHTLTLTMKSSWIPKVKSSLEELSYTSTLTFHIKLDISEEKETPLRDLAVAVSALSEKKLTNVTIDINSTDMPSLFEKDLESMGYQIENLKGKLGYFHLEIDFQVDPEILTYLCMAITQQVRIQNIGFISYETKYLIPFMLFKIKRWYTLSISAEQLCSLYKYSETFQYLKSPNLQKKIDDLQNTKNTPDYSDSGLSFYVRRFYLESDFLTKNSSNYEEIKLKIDEVAKRVIYLEFERITKDSKFEREKQFFEAYEFPNLKRLEINMVGIGYFDDEEITNLIEMLRAIKNTECKIHLTNILTAEGWPDLREKLTPDIIKKKKIYFSER